MMSTDLTGAQTRPGKLPAASGTRRRCALTRLVNAPRADVYRKWTEPELLAQRLEPYGLMDPVCEMELHPGGVFRVVMQARGGIQYVISFEETGRGTKVTLDAPFASIEECNAILALCPPDA